MKKKIFFVLGILLGVFLAVSLGLGIINRNYNLIFLSIFACIGIMMTLKFKNF